MSADVALAASPAARPDLEVNVGQLIDWDPTKYPGKKCLTAPGSKVCYAPGADQIYVLNRIKEAPAGWWNTPNRRGQCINNHGKGKWVVCQKNFTEHQNITIWSPWGSKTYKLTTRT
ncbi:hypothetical protein [Streptomyces platensis]